MKRVALLVLAAVLGLVGVLVARTLAPATAQVEPFVAPADGTFARDALADTLAAAIRCPTVAQGEPPRADPAAFACLHDVLRDAFPHLHDGARVTRTV
ncbi:MAG TPA: hypothetical protein VFO79_10640, partial [Xanthomonadales bacterium]|nr:hypothetical protein [Xanthomonadales bacterium]